MWLSEIASHFAWVRSKWRRSIQTYKGQICDVDENVHASTTMTMKMEVRRLKDHASVRVRLYMCTKIGLNQDVGGRKHTLIAQNKATQILENTCASTCLLHTKKRVVMPVSTILFCLHTFQSQRVRFWDVASGYHQTQKRHQCWINECDNIYIYICKWGVNATGIEGDPPLPGHVAHTGQ